MGTFSKHPYVKSKLSHYTCFLLLANSAKIRDTVLYCGHMSVSFTETLHIFMSRPSPGEEFT